LSNDVVIFFLQSDSPVDFCLNRRLNPFVSVL